MRLYIAFIFTFFFFRAYSSADTLNFVQKSPMPRPGRTYYASFVVDSNFYIIGGEDSLYIYIKKFGSIIFLLIVGYR